MAKKSSVKIVVVKCQCSVCGQVSNAQANTSHAYCLGMPAGFFDKAPQLKGRIRGPKKGEWKVWVKPEVAPIPDANIDLLQSALADLKAEQESKTQAA